VRDPEAVAGRARGDHGLGRAAGSVGVGALRVEPEPQRHADRVRARPEERHSAVDAAAHRDRDASRLWSGPEGLPECVRERVHRELLAADGRRFQQRQAVEWPLESLGLSTDDSLALDGQAHERPAAVARGIADGFDHAVQASDRPRRCWWARRLGRGPTLETALTPVVS
jgi:hypothetical protein